MYIAVGIGGICGSILRFLISEWFIGINIPLSGTLCVNLAGCFVLGALQGTARNYPLPAWLVMGLGTGLIGAFTTFSTFSMEVVTTIIQGQILLSIVYIMISSIGGYFFVSLGFALANRRGAKRYD